MEADLTTPFAVIDIGSNSVRLVVFDSQAREAFPLFNEKVQCGLGRQINETGKLSPTGWSAAIATIQRFVELCSAINANVRAIATAAVREAQDGDAFIQAISETCELTVEVLSGYEEARLAALGVSSSAVEAEGIIGDLGGGSLELVRLNHSVVNESATLPFGTLRDPSGDRREQSFINNIDSVISELVWPSLRHDATFYAVGGSWRAIAKVHMDQTEYPIRIVDQYSVACKDVINLCRLLSTQSPSSMKKISVVSRGRHKAIPYAALVLERLLLALTPERIVFSSSGIREGVLHDNRTAKEQSKDALLATCRKIATTQSRFSDHFEQTIEWLRPILLNGPPVQQRLNTAAGLLSDIGWQAHPDYRASYAFDRVLHAPLVGLTHADRAYLAAVLWTRYRGGEIDPKILDLVGREQAIQARVAGAAFDLAHTLSGGASVPLSLSKLKYDSNCLELCLDTTAQHLTSRLIEKRLRVLAEYLNCRWSIRFE